MKYPIHPSIGTLMVRFNTTQHAQLLSIDDFHRDVRSGRYRKPVEQIREYCRNGAPAEVITRLKAALPFFVAAGDCRQRRIPSCLKEPTGYAPFDIDHIPNSRAREIVALCSTIPWIKAAHLSSRGEGVHLFVAMGVTGSPADSRTYAEKFKLHYRIISQEIARCFGVEVDSQCKDVLRGMFASYDPDAFCRPDAEVEAFDFPEQQAEVSGRLLTSFLAAHPYQPSSRHQWWITFAQHLKMEKVQETQLEACREAMRGLLDSRGLILPDDPLLRDPAEVQKAMAWGYGHTTGKTQGSKVTKTELVEHFLTGKPLRYDVISRKVQIRDGELWNELSERETNTLWKECNSECGENIPFQIFRPMLLSSCIPAINPLTEYVCNCPDWQEGETDYIRQVAAMVHTVDGEKELWHTCFKKWFVAMVASWMQPETVNHQVLVLIGEQGIYKTTWLDALLPPELIQYRSKQSSADRLDKDELLRATEFGLVNLDEIDKMGERELNALKSLITTTDINIRAAYGYGKERRIRHASYVASGNKDRFLTDTTGNRRWLPFHIVSIDSPYDSPLPYAGMYAQARWLLQHGFNFWFTLDEIHSLSNHVDRFMVETNEEQLLPVYFTPARPGAQGCVFLTVAEISARLIQWGNIRHPMDIRQLGTLLKKLNFMQIRNGHNGTRGYLVIENSAESINAQRKLNAHPDAFTC